MKLKFGKFKGMDITDVEIDYIKWLEKQEWVKDDLREECQHQIKLREGDVSSLGKDVSKKDTSIRSYTVSIFKDGQMIKHIITGSNEAIDYVEAKLKKLANLEMGG